jgi:preprotein translocase subunit SecG
MATILLIVHLMVAVVLVVLVLLQRSEGGALGIGGGGGFMTGRSAGNALTRGTAIAAALFFATSLGLVLLAARGDSGSSILDKVAPAPVGSQGSAPAPVVPAPLGSGLDEKGAPAQAPEAPKAPAEPSVPRAQ